MRDADARHAIERHDDRSQPNLASLLTVRMMEVECVGKWQDVNRIDAA
jgi:hypothetical protein